MRVLFKIAIYTQLLFCFVSSAQNGITAYPGWYIKPVVQTGIILVHRNTIGHLVKGYPTIYELNFVKPTIGNKLWHIENNKPDLGITTQVIDFRNPQELGFGYVIAPFIEIPLNKREKSSRVIMRVCWGLSYFTKPFDVFTNQKNIAIGSHVNQYVQFKWFWQLPISKNLRLEPGFNFSHLSNGRTRNPNLGLNLLTLNLGMNINFKPSKLKSIAIAAVDSNTKVKSKNELFLYAAAGFNQREINQQHLYSYSVNFLYQRNVRNTHKWSAGVSLFADQNYLNDYKAINNNEGNGLNMLRAAVMVGYSYNIGRLSIPLETGYYFYDKVGPDGRITSKLSLRYYAKNGLVVHMGLRTHFAVAYNFEYGLGYKLNF